MTHDITLIIGGARSGKSRFSESYSLEMGLSPIYVATGESRDDEMRVRIQHHQDSRDDRWVTMEEPLALAALIERETKPGRVLLIDCLTLWLNNHLEIQSNIAEETSALIDALEKAAGPVVLVTNEVGQGIVPLNELARAFRDEAGRLNQAVAGAAQNVYAVMAGLTLPLKVKNVPVGPKF